MLVLSFTVKPNYPQTKLSLCVGVQISLLLLNGCDRIPQYSWRILICLILDDAYSPGQWRWSKSETYCSTSRAQKCWPWNYLCGMLIVHWRSINISIHLNIHFSYSSWFQLGQPHHMISTGHNNANFCIKLYAKSWKRCVERIQKAGLSLNTYQTTHEANDCGRHASIVKLNESMHCLRTALYVAELLDESSCKQGAFEMRYSFLYFFSLVQISKFCTQISVHWHTVYASPSGCVHEFVIFSQILRRNCLHMPIMTG